MRTTVELPDDLFRKAKARAALQGRALKDLVAEGLKVMLESPKEVKSAAPPRHTRRPIETMKQPARKRGSAGAWARRFAGVASLASTETTDDARLDHYRKKYGV